MQNTIRLGSDSTHSTSTAYSKVSSLYGFLGTTSRGVNDIMLIFIGHRDQNNAHALLYFSLYCNQSWSIRK